MVSTLSYFLITDSRSLFLDSSVSQSLLNGLSHYNDNNVRCSIKVFCHFYLHGMILPDPFCHLPTSRLIGHLQDLLLDVILLALTSLKAQDHNIQRSGITILAGLAEHSKGEPLMS